MRNLVMELAKLIDPSTGAYKRVPIGVELKNVLGYSDSVKLYPKEIRRKYDEEAKQQLIQYFNDREEILWTIRYDDALMEASLRPITSGRMYQIMKDLNDHLAAGGDGTLNKVDIPAKKYLTGTIQDTENVDHQYFDPAVYSQDSILHAKGLIIDEGGEDIHGNIDTATKWQTPRLFQISGGATADPILVDGTSDVDFNVRELDATKVVGVLPLDTIPPKALERIYFVDDIADSSWENGVLTTKEDNDPTRAIFTLTIDQVQNGDTVKERVSGRMFLVVDDTQLDNENGYEHYAAGSAAQASKLETPRNINGVPFDGTRDITIVSDAKVNALNDGQDLNAITHPGQYYGPLNNTCINTPADYDSSVSSFALEVLARDESGSGQVVQLFIGNRNPAPMTLANAEPTTGNTGEPPLPPVIEGGGIVDTPVEDPVTPTEPVTPPTEESGGSSTEEGTTDPTTPPTEIIGDGTTEPEFPAEETPSITDSTTEEGDGRVGYSNHGAQIFYRLLGTITTDWIMLYSTNRRPTQLELGMENVDNTHDLNKPISLQTERRLQEFKDQLDTIGLGIPIRNTDCGIMDTEGVIISTWDTLVNDFGLDITKDYDPETIAEDTSSALYIFTNNKFEGARTLVIPQTITSIGAYAFYGLEGLNLEIAYADPADEDRIFVGGIKGDAEPYYRRGLVNITPADLGLNKAGVDIAIPSAPSTILSTDSTSAIVGGTINIPNRTFMSGFKTFVGSVYTEEDSTWSNMISVRHRNGSEDGTAYGMYLASNLTTAGNLVWRRQMSSTWTEEAIILDQNNYNTFALPLTGGIMTGSIHFYTNSDLGEKPGIGGSTTTDRWDIYHDVVGSDEMRLIIKTQDNMTEPILVQQQSGSNIRTLTLLDGNGNTVFPGTVYANNIEFRSTNNQLRRAGKSSSWVEGRDNAILRMTSRDGYSPAISIAGTDGTWELGTYTDDILHISYITNSNYNSRNNTQTADFYFDKNMGALHFPNNHTSVLSKNYNINIHNGDIVGINNIVVHSEQISPCLNFPRNNIDNDNWDNIIADGFFMREGRAIFRFGYKLTNHPTYRTDSDYHPMLSLWAFEPLCNKSLSKNQCSYSSFKHVAMGVSSSLFSSSIINNAPFINVFRNDIHYGPVLDNWNCHGASIFFSCHDVHCFLSGHYLESGNAQLAGGNGNVINWIRTISFTGSSSDIRYKTNIKAINKSLSINLINKCNPIQYYYTKDEAKGREQLHYGLSAQEIEQIVIDSGNNPSDIALFHMIKVGDIDDPHNLPENNRYTIIYEEMIAHLINYVQDLNKRIDYLESRL